MPLRKSDVAAEFIFDKQLDCASKHLSIRQNAAIGRRLDTNGVLLFIFSIPPWSTAQSKQFAFSLPFYLYLFVSLRLRAVFLTLIVQKMLFRKDPCGIICIALTYAMLLHCLYVILFVIILPLLSDRYSISIELICVHCAVMSISLVYMGL